MRKYPRQPLVAAFCGQYAWGLNDKKVLLAFYYERASEASERVYSEVYTKNLHSNLKLQIIFLKLRNSKTILDTKKKIIANKRDLPYLLRSRNENLFFYLILEIFALEWSEPLAVRFVNC